MSSEMFGVQLHENAASQPGIPKRLSTQSNWNNSDGSHINDSVQFNLQQEVTGLYLLEWQHNGRMFQEKLIYVFNTLRTG
jgi:hypothetical protein